jgi:hypothetical protein
MTPRQIAAGAAAVFGIAVILAAVGGPAAVASYHHAYQVFLTYGEVESRAAWLPLTTDGMLAAALVVMYSRRWGRQPVGFVPWLAFVVGLFGTLAANLASANAFGAPSVGEGIGRLAAAVWPPIVFAVTLELVAVMLGRLRDYVTRQRDAVSTTWPATWLVGIPEYPYRPPAEDTTEDTGPAPVPDPVGDALAAAARSVPGVYPLRTVEDVEAWNARRTRTRETRPRTRRTRTPDPRPGTAGTPEPGTPNPGTNGKAVRWTEQDEAVRIDLQAQTDETGTVPSVRDIAARYSMGKDRARKILDRVQVHPRVDEDAEPGR